MILTLHIAGGIVTFMSVATIFFGAWRNWKLDWSKPLLPLLAGWQAVTGLLLVAVGGSLVRTCLSGMVYLAITGLAYMHVRRLQTVPNA